MHLVRRLIRFVQELTPGSRNLAAESLRNYPGTPINSDKYIDTVDTSRDTRFLKALLKCQGHSSTSIAKHNRQIRESSRRDYHGVINDYRKAHPCTRFDNVGFEFVDSGTANAVAVHVRADNSFAIGMDPRLHTAGAWLIDLAYVAYHQNAPEDFLRAVAHSVQSTFLGVPLSEEENAFYFHYLGLAESVSPVWREWIGPMVAQFLIGHELGHIYLDHFANAKAACLRLNPQADRDDEISAFAQRQEFEADAWAIRSMIGRKTGSVIFNLTSRTIPPILFSIFAVIDDLYEPNTTMAATLHKSHPRASERAAELSKIGALPSGVRIPRKDLEALFLLPDFINSARLRPAFQEYAGRFRHHEWQA